MKAMYQVFVSSTLKDLREERQAVMEEILDAGHIPTAMERFPAGDDTPWQYVQKRIVTADYFLLILAGCYGSTDSDGHKSFTQQEYEYALVKRIPIAVLLLDEDRLSDWPGGDGDSFAQEKLQKFRDLVSIARVCKTWTNVHELRRHAGRALEQLIKSRRRPGWIRSDVVFENLKQGDSKSARASSCLKAAVEHDLERVGYYRKDQILEFSIRREQARCVLALRFSAKIIPVRRQVEVYKPMIDPPDGVVEFGARYFVGTVDVDKSKSRTIDRPTTDLLEVKYLLSEVNDVDVWDLHLFPSPVINYTVKFKSDCFAFRIGIFQGMQVGAAPIELKASPDGLTSDGRGSALSRQGLKWELLRKPTGSDRMQSLRGDVPV